MIVSLKELARLQGPSPEFSSVGPGRGWANLESSRLVIS